MLGGPVPDVAHGQRAVLNLAVAAVRIGLDQLHPAQQHRIHLGAALVEPRLRLGAGVGKEVAEAQLQRADTLDVARTWHRALPVPDTSDVFASTTWGRCL